MLSLACLSVIHSVESLSGRPIFCDIPNFNLYYYWTNASCHLLVAAWLKLVSKLFSLSFLVVPILTENLLLLPLLIVVRVLFNQCYFFQE